MAHYEMSPCDIYSILSKNKFDAFNSKLLVLEFIGPIGHTTYSRHASLLLSKNIYFDVGRTHLPFTINMKHRHQLIQRMFKTLQAT